MKIGAFLFCIFFSAFMLSNTAVAASYPKKCIETQVKVRETRFIDYYCWTDGTDAISHDSTGGIIVGRMGEGTSTQGLAKGPTPPPVKTVQKSTCLADKFGTKFPHKEGFREEIIPGFGYENYLDGTSYVIPKQDPIHPFKDTALEGDTSVEQKLTVIYYYGWHSTIVDKVDGIQLTSGEKLLYTLVHERGHQNLVDDDSVGGLNDQAGEEAVRKARADTTNACSQFN